MVGWRGFPTGEAESPKTPTAGPLGLGVGVMLQGTGLGNGATAVSRLVREELSEPGVLSQETGCANGAEAVVTRLTGEELSKLGDCRSLPG